MKWRHVVMAAVAAVFVCQAAVADEIVTFADPNLEAAVREKLGIAEPDPVTSTDMLGLYSLNVHDGGIVDLGGLEYASHFEILVANINEVSRVDPLRGLTELIGLHLHSNLLTDISPLSGLTKLWDLNLGGNALTQVDALSQMAELTALAVDDNLISDVAGLAGLGQLRTLDLTENQLQDISTLVTLSDLRVVSLQDNQVSDISPLAGLGELVYLDLRGNPLNQAAYDTYLPLIQANNPGIDLRYDPIPEPGSLVLVSLGALALAVRSRGGHGVRLPSRRSRS